VIEFARWSVVGLDGIAQLDGGLGGGEAADHGGRVQQVAYGAGVQCLPASPVIQHLGEVGDEHVIVWCRVTGSRSGVPCGAHNSPPVGVRRCERPRRPP